MNCGGQSREILRAPPPIPLNMCSSLMRGCCRRNVGDTDWSPDRFRQTEYGVKRHWHVGMILRTKCIFFERMLISRFDFLMTCWASIWRLCVKECKQSRQAITVSLLLFMTLWQTSVASGLQDEVIIAIPFHCASQQGIVFLYLTDSQPLQAILQSPR